MTDRPCPEAESYYSVYRTDFPHCPKGVGAPTLAATASPGRHEGFASG